MTELHNTMNQTSLIDIYRARLQTTVHSFYVYTEY